MALTTTTLNGAVAVDDNKITVTSGTSFAAGSFILIDQEVMEIAADYVSGTSVGVLRGREGTKTQAHVTGANVVMGTGADWAAYAPHVTTPFPIAGRARTVTSYTAAGAITLPLPGNDATAVLNGTSVLAMTIAAPTKDMDGCELGILGNGAAAHTLTFAGGLSGAGASYDVVTINATAPTAMKVVACNGLWLAYFGPAMGGTVTNLIGSVA